MVSPISYTDNAETGKNYLIARDLGDFDPAFIAACSTTQSGGGLCVVITDNQIKQEIHFRTRSRLEFPVSLSVDNTSRTVAILTRDGDFNRGVVYSARLHRGAVIYGKPELVELSADPDARPYLCVTEYWIKFKSAAGGHDREMQNFHLPEPDKSERV